MHPTLPHWAELPSIDLYLDQVLLYVNETVANSAFPIKPLTAAMVNNYVKHKYIAKPYKKKYNKQQIAQLIAITLLKETFSIQDVPYAIAKLKTTYSSEALYDAFISALTAQQPLSQNVPDVISSACQTLKQYHHTYKLMNCWEEKHDDSN